MSRRNRKPLYFHIATFSRILNSSVLPALFSLIPAYKNLSSIGTRFYLYLIISLLPLFLATSYLGFNGLHSSFSPYLFFFSFIIYFAALYSCGYDQLLKFISYLIIFSFAFNLIEFIVFNSPLSDSVPYFPASHPHRALTYGIQKALGPSSISSASGFLAVYLFIIYQISNGPHPKRMYFCTLSSVLLLMSGTGFFLLFLYQIMQPLSNVNATRFFRSSQIPKLLVPILLVTLLFFSLLSISGIDKFSSNYFFSILSYKLLQADSLTSIASPFAILFGPATLGLSDFTTSADFGFLSVLNNYGVIGLLIYLASPLFLAQSMPYFFLVLLLFSLYHYPAFGSSFGCLVLAISFSISISSSRSTMR